MTTTSSPRPIISPALVLLLGLTAMSAASIFVRQARSAGAPSLIIAAYRLTLAAALLAPYTLVRHRSDLARLSRRDWSAALVAGVFLGLHFAAWIASLDFTTIAASIVLVTTSPLWVALAAAVFLREPLTRPVVIGLALALAGGLMITGAASECAEGSLCNAPLLGDALALAGAIAIAVYFLIGRRLRRSLPLAPYVFLVYGMSAATLLIAVAVAGLSFTGQPVSYSADALGWIALLAIGPQLIGHSSLNYALKYLPTTFVAVATLGEPIGSTILAFVVLHEQPSLATWIGGALILAGIAAASHASGAP